MRTKTFSGEGEILLKEKYGSSSREIIYVQYPHENNVVAIEESSTSSIRKWLTTIFLPHGYPDSVSNDYMAYQVWDTAQAFCSTVTGILATQEVLRGVGVGDTTATPLAATITWVVKDGCGHIGRILFAFSHGTQLDAFSKKWRLYADTLNDAAMCIEIALPMFKSYTTVALCISTVMKAIVGVAGGATRIAMTQHHALRGNMADVAAKDSAQETAVNLVASLVALLIITLLGNSLILFIIMAVFHITFNYLAVRAVCLRTFNEPRLLDTIQGYLQKEMIATPYQVNMLEPLVFYQIGGNLLDYKICGFQIKLGHSINNIHKSASTALLKTLKTIHRERQYIPVPNITTRKMYVLVKEGATTDDVLCGYFHAVLLSIIICAINDEKLALYYNVKDPRPFAQVCLTLQRAEWSRELTKPASHSRGHFKYNPSAEALKYVDKITQHEWKIVRDCLQDTDWDLTKHLLLVDEWRITKELSPVAISESHVEDVISKNLAPRSNITFQDAHSIDKSNLHSSLSDSSLMTLIQPDRAKADKGDRTTPSNLQMAFLAD